MRRMACRRRSETVGEAGVEKSVAVRRRWITQHCTGPAYYQSGRIAETVAHNLDADANIEWASDSRSLRVVVQSEVLWEYGIHVA